MQDQQRPPANGVSPETENHSNMVPYERFAEVNRQLKALKAELAELKMQAPKQEQEPGEAQTYTVEEIFKRLVEDPEGYLRELMAQVMQDELQMLREEMELRSALTHARQRYPEFQSFENYIIQELMNVVDEDPDAGKLTWDEILDKGMERVKEKFQTAVQNAPEQFSAGTRDDVRKAHVEGSTPRKPQPVMPSFSRNDIARMSLEEFVQNEEAINLALKNNLIR